MGTELLIPLKMRTPPNRTVSLDRDGVINKIIYRDRRLRQGISKSSSLKHEIEKHSRPRLTTWRAGNSAGCRAIILDREYNFGYPADWHVSSLSGAVDLILKRSHQAFGAGG